MAKTSDEKIKVLIIAGPTAVGKTEFALHAASKFNGEIISCDSMQIYKGMDIGTAKPSEKELALVTHHMIDVADPFEEFSAAMYSSMARDAIRKTADKGSLPVVCGGTGLYLDGILYDMDYGKGPQDPELRESLSEKAETEGSLALHKELSELDPAAAEEIHPNNTKRLIRALERIYLGEESLKSFEERRTINEALDPLMIGLERPREELYQRINERVDQMMAEGLEDEVRALAGKGLSIDNPSMLGIGYKEMISYIDGKTSIDEAVEQIKKSTRHYAKRQFTWFRRYDKMRWIDISSAEDCSSHRKAKDEMDRMIEEWLLK